MTRPAGYIPQHCHHKPTDTGYVRLNGKPFYTGKWGSPQSRSEYDRLIRGWIASGRKPLDFSTEVKGYVVDDLFADFWLYAKEWYRRPDGTPTGELEKIRYALKPARVLFGKLCADSFGPKQLKVYRESLIDRDLCRNLVNQQVGIVRRVFNWAVGEEKVPAEVDVDDKQQPKKKKKSKPFVEIRADGSQTMFPPSIHPSGEPVRPISLSSQRAQ